MLRRVALTLLASTLLSSCEPANEPDAVTANLSASTALQDLFDEEWAWRLAREPRLATYAGIGDYDDQLGSVTPAAYAERAAYWTAVLERLDAIEPDLVDRADRINARMFRRQLEGYITEIAFRDYEMPLNSDEGFHIDFARLPESVPLESVADYEHYISRMQAWPRLAAEHIANMRAGIARGFTIPQVVLIGYDATIAGHVVDAPEDSVFFAPFTRFPATISDADQDRLTAAGRNAIMGSVVPGYSDFLTFFRDEYFPNARQTLGASDLPDGAAYYAHKVRWFTTLDLTPQAIHELGLREVARIRAEMQTVIEEVGFDGSFDAFLTFLRTDPQFYADSPQALLEHAAWIAKTMDGRLPALFGTLPRLPYTVNPVPEHLAPKYTTGRYIPAAAGSTQPGQYWVNTYDLPSRTLYTLPALTLHEAVPGHHLQGAIAMEQAAQPDFRQFDYISAYGEGWGLYSEYLGIEAGIYRTPYERFGRMTYEMWRAVRLVVDTGIHTQGWSRQQVMDYMAANTALSLHEIETETDRYISWPAQALSYKLGELKIRELRARAETALGERFDLRAFHDAILVNGSVPLDILESEIDRWIAAQM
jgi:uncharacterized protein (DUF885 family)